MWCWERWTVRKKNIFTFFFLSLFSPNSHGQYHPDKQHRDTSSEQDTEGARKFIEISRAWKILGNEEAKRAYDLHRRGKTSLFGEAAARLHLLRVNKLGPFYPEPFAPCLINNRRQMRATMRRTVSSSLLLLYTTENWAILERNSYNYIAEGTFSLGPLGKLLAFNDSSVLTASLQSPLTSWVHMLRPKATADRAASGFHSCVSGLWFLTP